MHHARPIHFHEHYSWRFNQGLSRSSSVRLKWALFAVKAVLQELTVLALVMISGLANKRDGGIFTRSKNQQARVGLHEMA